MSDLFSALSAAEHFRDPAWVGYYNGDTGLAQGFAEAAEAIFSVWQCQARSNDRLLPPIAYNYRHALELALKQAIRQAAACRQLNGDADPGLTPQALEAHFKQKQRHRLGPLAQQLARLLADLNLELPRVRRPSYLDSLAENAGICDFTCSIGQDRPPHNQMPVVPPARRTSPCCARLILASTTCSRTGYEAEDGAGVPSIARSMNNVDTPDDRSS